MIPSNLLLALVFVWLLLVVAYARRLLADWREPVLHEPVLIFESDDWGPGPPADADRLRRLAMVLQGFCDASGRSPVATLGVVLAVPAGGGQMRRDGTRRYLRATLDEERFASVLSAMLAGQKAGVFALQQHGMEHFWPAALVAAAEREPLVRAFLEGDGGVPRHESLPPPLQARWIDASRLPSIALDREAIERAVAEETECFARIFGIAAQVAVPVTFTWTTDVEAAWAAHGIRVLVTPGTRNIGRDGLGHLIGDRSMMRNGDRAAGGMVCVVRDIYFEPALGHTAARVLADIRAHHQLGRPALLEMHRFNFTGEGVEADASFVELRRVLEGARDSIPRLRYLSTLELAEALRVRDPALVDRRLAARVRALVLRAATQPRLYKLAWITGLAAVAAAALAIATASLRPAPEQRQRPR